MSEVLLRSPARCFCTMCPVIAKGLLSCINGSLPKYFVSAESCKLGTKSAERITKDYLVVESSVVALEHKNV